MRADACHPPTLDLDAQREYVAALSRARGGRAPAPILNRGVEAEVAPIVREVAGRDVTLGGLAETLQARGVRCPGGGEWTAPAARRALCLLRT